MDPIIAQPLGGTEAYVAVEGCSSGPQKDAEHALETLRQSTSKR